MPVPLVQNLVAVMGICTYITLGSGEITDALGGTYFSVLCFRTRGSKAVCYSDVPHAKTGSLDTGVERFGDSLSLRITSLHPYRSFFCSEGYLPIVDVHKSSIWVSPCLYGVAA